MEDTKIGAELKLQLLDDLTVNQAENPAGCVMDAAFEHTVGAAAGSLFEHSASLHLGMATVARVLAFSPLKADSVMSALDAATVRRFEPQIHHFALDAICSDTRDLVTHVSTNYWISLSTIRKTLTTYVVSNPFKNEFLKQNKVILGSFTK